MRTKQAAVTTLVSKPRFLHVAHSLPAWLRHAAYMCLAIISVATFAAPASAQWRVGGFLGGEHDSSWDEFLVIGADARGAVGTRNIELNPRVSYFLRDGTTRLQLDLNVIKPLTLSGSSRLVPFVGAGLALERISFDDVTTGTGTPVSVSETYVGYNYIMGATVNVTGRVQPFTQFTYSVLNDAGNTAVLSFGLHFKLGASR